VEQARFALELEVNQARQAMITTNKKIGEDINRIIQKISDTDASIG
jgi:hypothetical protein